MRFFSLFLACALIFFFPLPGARAEGPSLSTVIESTATVKITEENWAAAREEAIDLAMRQAVSNRVSQLLEAEGKSFDNHQTALEGILKEGDSYVQSYQILEEIKNGEDRSLTVRLNTGLFNSDLVKALFQLGVGSEMPPGKTQVAFLIGEKNLREDGRTLPFVDFQPVSEGFLLEFFREKGVEILDRGAVAEMSSEEDLNKAVKGDIEAAMGVGVQCGVEAVIMGTAISRKLPPDPKKPHGFSTQANISLRLIRVDKGAVVAARSEFATGVGATEEESEREAMNQASLKLGDFFEKQIKNLWK